MLRYVLLCTSFLLCSVSLLAQLKKFYTLRESVHFDTVSFHLDASSGNSYIRNYSHHVDPLVIYGNPDLEKINPSFQTQIDGRLCKALLKLDTYNAHDFGDGFSFVISRKEKEEDGDYWKVLVNDDKVYQFRMNYGVGNTEVNLSNVKAQKLWLNTGSANVRILYDKDRPNKIAMDTFFVKVDLGTLFTENLRNAHAGTFIADIGFGSAILDFSGKSATRALQCNAKIGAGALDVKIPNASCPVIIHMNNSPFCGIQMAEGFEEVEKNVFVNPSYNAHAPDLMTFNIDLSVGTISFSYVE